MYYQLNNQDDISSKSAQKIARASGVTNIPLTTKLFVFLLLCVLAEAGFAVTDSNNQNHDQTVLEVSGIRLSQPIFNTMYRSQSEKSDLSEREFKRDVIDALLLWQYAQESLSPTSYQSAKVAFGSEWHIKQQLYSLLRKHFDDVTKEQINSHSKVQPKSSKPKLNTYPLTQEQLNKVIGPVGFIGYHLSEKQAYDAQAVVLAESISFQTSAYVQTREDAQTSAHQLKQTDSSKLTLYDVYQQSSVQIRKLMYEGNTDLVDNQVQQWINQQQLTTLLLESGQLSTLELRHIQTIISALHHQPAILNAIGAIKRHHGDNRGLEVFKNDVSAEEISHFYQKHKQDFRYIDSVTVSYSFYDRKADALGQGSFHHKNKTIKLPADTWLSNLAASIELGKRIGPLRSPHGQWVTIMAHNKSQAYYPPSSETVRYQATAAIAQQKARESYQHLMDSLYRNAGLTYTKKDTAIFDQKSSHR